jgi:hypothetical protein
MAANTPATFQPSAAALSKALFAAVGERYYKVGGAAWSRPAQLCGE